MKLRLKLVSAKRLPFWSGLGGGRLIMVYDHVTRQVGQQFKSIISLWLTWGAKSLRFFVNILYCSGNLIDTGSNYAEQWGRQTQKYRQKSNISRTLVGNKIVIDHSDEVGASPVGAAPTTSSFST